jgi:hypothetical protein
MVPRHASVAAAAAVVEGINARHDMDRRRRTGVGFMGTIMCFLGKSPPPPFELVVVAAEVVATVEEDVVSTPVVLEAFVLVVDVAYMAASAAFVWINDI